VLAASLAEVHGELSFLDNLTKKAEQLQVEQARRTELLVVRDALDAQK
jgi:hypothetical protein